MNVIYALSFGGVKSTTKYLRHRDVIVGDVKYFDQFCNLKTFVRSVLNDKDFKSASVSNKWAKYFQKSCNSDCHSELL
jgi:hypothetical protein